MRKPYYCRFYCQMMFSIVCCIASCIVSFYGFAQHQSKVEVLWLATSHQDNRHFGKDSKVNIATDTNNLLLKALSNYQIKLRIHPLQRIEHLMRKSKNTCMPNRIKTPERLKTSLFSLPLNMYPMLRLYTLSSNTSVQPVLVNQQLSSLNQLFKQLPTHSLGLSRGRSYGKFFDRQIVNINPNNIYQRATDSGLLSLIEMLNRGRINYVIEYPTQMRSEMADIVNPQGIKSIKIANSPNYIIGYLACSKSKFAQQFINDVDTALRHLYQTNEFYQAHRRYLNDTDIEQFDQDYKQVFVY